MDTVIDTLPSSEQAGMEVSEYNNMLSDIQNAIQNSSAIDSIAKNIRMHSPKDFVMAKHLMK